VWLCCPPGFGVLVGGNCCCVWPVQVHVLDVGKWKGRGGGAGKPNSVIQKGWAGASFCPAAARLPLPNMIPPLPALAAAGDSEWQQLLGSFWAPFHQKVTEVGQVPVTDVVSQLDAALELFMFPPMPDGSDPRCVCVGGGVQISSCQGVGGWVGGCVWGGGLHSITC